MSFSHACILACPYMLFKNKDVNLLVIAGKFWCLSLTSIVQWKWMEVIFVLRGEYLGLLNFYVILGCGRHLRLITKGSRTCLFGQISVFYWDRWRIILLIKSFELYSMSCVRVLREFYKGVMLLQSLKRFIKVCYSTHCFNDWVLIFSFPMVSKWQTQTFDKSLSQS